MKKLKNWLIDYFNISQTEANGFLVLSFLLLLTIFLPIFVRWSYADRTLVSTDDQLLLDSLVAQL
ncbi:MAG: helix-hairpin-helix domain-containing protein, partial [Flammeovirgaceae bacterium]|nr:helix-hairpin-helix domain-containing protein [Flammeovirgaceae bacterium]